MTKAKIGDQRFKKKSYLPHIIAVLSVLFVIAGSIFALSSIFRADDLSLEAQLLVTPRPTVDYVSTAESLWEHPRVHPSYVSLTPANRRMTQESKLCFVLSTTSDVLTPPAPVYSHVVIDGSWLPYFRMEWNQPYCFQPDVKKGYHLIELNALSFSQWGILVE